VSVTLRAEAEDGAGFAFEHAEVGVFVSVDFSHEWWVCLVCESEDQARWQNDE
jgi:hypothetical protein